MIFTFYLWVRVGVSFVPLLAVREHRIPANLCMLCIVVFLHGLVLGRLRVHHQHHPDLRRPDDRRA